MRKSSRAVLALPALLSCLAIASAALPAAASASVVRYQGREIGVPAGWPVYFLSRHPALCVRLDRPAVYVGRPGRTQRCPAHVVGRSRAILIEPHGASAVVLHGPRAVAPSGGGTPTGTPPGPGSGSRAPAASVIGATFSGLGFDPCTAPSVTQMAAWLSSPYRAVGIYIGGTNMGCSQPNLTAGWVSQESAAGWHLIPTYVGLQAPANSCGCAGISSPRATAQGVAAANDAVARAAALGLGRGNPIYTDMEYYPRGSTNSAAVLAYLSGWTAQLHASGYLSGVYGNSDSVIADLLTREGTGYPEPDDIWFAEWNGVPTVNSSYIPSGFWVGHRLHQYSGGQNATYGGVTINIDSDAMDGATAAAGSATLAKVPFSDGTFVQVSGKQAIYRIAGGAPLVVKDWTGLGGPQPYKVISERQFAALNKVPANGTFLNSTWGAPYSVTSTFRVAGGCGAADHQRGAVRRYRVRGRDRPVGHPAPAQPPGAPGPPSRRRHDRRGAPLADLLGVPGRLAPDRVGDRVRHAGRRRCAERVPDGPVPGPGATRADASPGAGGRPGRGLRGWKGAPAPRAAAASVPARRPAVPGPRLVARSAEAGEPDAGVDPY